MKILALDASAKPVSVSFYDTSSPETPVFEFQNSGYTHSVTLLPMLDRVLKKASVPLSAVDLFAVSVGPGSFTGVRIGVGTVKGLAQAAEKPCAGVSTLEAMAAEHVDFQGVLSCCMDARRGQVYNALFEIKERLPHRLCPDRAIPLEALSEELSLLNKPVLLVGDGAELAFSFTKSENVQLAPKSRRFQTALGVALAAEKAPKIAASELLPVYLRLPQAEREMIEKNNKKEA